jgi:hypothetical protein
VRAVLPLSYLPVGLGRAKARPFFLPRAQAPIVGPPAFA